MSTFVDSRNADQIASCSIQHSLLLNQNSQRLSTFHSNRSPGEVVNVLRQVGAAVFFVLILMIDFFTMNVL